MVCFGLGWVGLGWFPLAMSRSELDIGQSTAQGKGALHHVHIKCPKACLEDVLYTLLTLTASTVGSSHVFSPFPAL